MVTTTESIKKLFSIVERVTVPDMFMDACGVPYDPEKCSAKSAAAILGASIPVLSYNLGVPIVEIGGVSVVWTGTHFNPFDAHQKRSIIKQFAQSAGLLRANILTSDFQREYDRSFSMYGKAEEVFPDTTACKGINFADGMLRLNDGEHKFTPGHKPEDMATYCIPAPWSKPCHSSAWDKFVNETIPDEDIRDYVLAVLGNAIANDPMRAQKVLLFIGAAGAGKSTLIEAISGCLGAQNVMRTDNLAQITRDDSRHRMRLAQATLCISADASANIGDKDALKMIVSKEPIIARKLYQEPVEITPRASLVVASNELGLSYALSDEGVARRFDIISFNFAKPVTERDSNLISKLSTDEAKGAIGKCLAQSLIKHVKVNNGLIRPVKLQDQLDQLQRDGDPFMTWMNESGIFNDPASKGKVEVSQDESYQSFRTFCVKNGYNQWSLRKFKSRMRTACEQCEGKRGGKHSFLFSLRDIHLARASGVIGILDAGKSN